MTYDIICWYCGQHLGSDLNGDEVAQHAADNPVHGTTLRVERSAPATVQASSGGYQPLEARQQGQGSSEGNVAEDVAAAEAHKSRRGRV
jgi:hypothetical protein